MPQRKKPTAVGKLIWEALIFVEGRKGFSRSEAKEALAEYCFVEVSTVNSWRSLRRPTAESFERLVEWGVDKAEMGFDWFDRICHAYKYYEKEALEKQLKTLRSSQHIDHSTTILEDLPRFSSRFIGREREIAAVIKALNSREGVVALIGLPGSGKSSLANKVARVCIEDLPESPFQVVKWISLDEIFAAENILDALLLTLANNSIYPDTQSIRTATARFLTDKAVLIILDNFELVREPVRIIEFFNRLPRKSRSRVIVTSKEANDLPVERFLYLDGLTQAEAVIKIRDEAAGQGLRNVANAPDSALLPLYQITNGNPKALEMAVGHMRVNSRSMQDVVTDLEAAAEDVANVFSFFFETGWNRFSTIEKQLFLTIGLFAGSFSKKAWCYIVDNVNRCVDKGIVTLQNLGFVATDGAIMREELRYSTHPLVKAQARKLAVTMNAKTIRFRWVQYFLRFVKTHLIRSKPDIIYWNSLLHSDTDIGKVDQELLNLLQVLEWVSIHDDLVLIEFMMTLTHYLGRRRFKARLKYCRLAAKAALDRNRYYEASILKIDGLGWAYLEMHQFAEAKRCFEEGKSYAMSCKNVQQRDNLLTLADTFLAAICVERDALVAAQRLLPDMANRGLYECVRQRLVTIKGDFHLRSSYLHKEASAERKRELDLARRNYELCIVTNRAYAGDFQKDINNRLGYVYLLLGDSKQARGKFQTVTKDLSASSFNRIRAYCGMAQTFLDDDAKDMGKARHYVRVAQALESDFRQSEEMPISDELSKSIREIESLIV